ncbi:MAG: SHOCT domain-containing protein [Proteobacteria bacterium]|nr:SHOCT domain-containing protein [Pseudomonadota bacterium]
MLTRRAIIGMGVLAASLLAGCATPQTGLRQIAPDTYRISRVDPGGQYADPAAMRAAVVAEAAAFARGKGGTALEVASHEETLPVGRLSTIDYDFRVAPAGATAALPAAQGTPARPAPAAVPAAGTAPEAGAAPAASAPPTRAALPAPPGSGAEPPRTAASAVSQLHEDLLKLEDLRRRGILTDEEFARLKQRLIEAR